MGWRRSPAARSRSRQSLVSGHRCGLFSREAMRNRMLIRCLAATPLRPARAWEAVEVYRSDRPRRPTKILGANTYPTPTTALANGHDPTRRSRLRVAKDPLICKSLDLILRSVSDSAIHLTASIIGEAGSILSRMRSTGFAGASEARVLDRIEPLATLAAQRCMESCDFPRRRQKSQVPTFAFHHSHKGSNSQPGRRLQATHILSSLASEAISAFRSLNHRFMSFPRRPRRSKRRVLERHHAFAAGH